MKKYQGAVPVFSTVMVRYDDESPLLRVIGLGVTLTSMPSYPSGVGVGAGGVAVGFGAQHGAVPVGVGDVPPAEPGVPAEEGVACPPDPFPLDPPFVSPVVVGIAEGVPFPCVCVATPSVALVAIALPTYDCGPVEPDPVLLLPLERKAPPANREATMTASARAASPGTAKRRSRTIAHSALNPPRMSSSSFPYSVYQCAMKHGGWVGWIHRSG